MPHSNKIESKNSVAWQPQSSTQREGANKIQRVTKIALAIIITLGFLALGGSGATLYLSGLNSLLFIGVSGTLGLTGLALEAWSMALIVSITKRKKAALSKPIIPSASPQPKPHYSQYSPQCQEILELKDSELFAHLKTLPIYPAETYSLKEFLDEIAINVNKDSKERTSLRKVLSYCPESFSKINPEDLKLEIVTYALNIIAEDQEGYESILLRLMARQIKSINFETPEISRKKILKHFKTLINVAKDRELFTSITIHIYPLMSCAQKKDFLACCSLPNVNPFAAILVSSEDLQNDDAEAIFARHEERKYPIVDYLIENKYFDGLQDTTYKLIAPYFTAQLIEVELKTFLNNSSSVENVILNIFNHTPDDQKTAILQVLKQCPTILAKLPLTVTINNESRLVFDVLDEGSQLIYLQALSLEKFKEFLTSCPEKLFTHYENLKKEVDSCSELAITTLKRYPSLLAQLPLSVLINENSRLIFDEVDSELQLQYLQALNEVKFKDFLNAYPEKLFAYYEKLKERVLSNVDIVSFLNEHHLAIELNYLTKAALDLENFNELNNVLVEKLYLYAENQFKDNSPLSHNLFQKMSRRKDIVEIVSKNLTTHNQFVAYVYKELSNDDSKNLAELINLLEASKQILVLESLFNSYKAEEVNDKLNNILCFLKRREEMKEQFKERAGENLATSPFSALLDLWFKYEFYDLEHKYLDGQNTDEVITAAFQSRYLPSLSSKLSLAQIKITNNYFSENLNMKDICHLKPDALLAVFEVVDNEIRGKILKELENSKIQQDAPSDLTLQNSSKIERVSAKDRFKKFFKLKKSDADKNASENSNRTSLDKSMFPINMFYKNLDDMLSEVQSTKNLEERNLLNSIQFLSNQGITVEADYPNLSKAVSLIIKP